MHAIEILYLESDTWLKPSQTDWLSLSLSILQGEWLWFLWLCRAMLQMTKTLHFFNTQMIWAANWFWSSYLYNSCFYPCFRAVHCRLRLLGSLPELLCFGCYLLIFHIAADLPFHCAWGNAILIGWVDPLITSYTIHFLHWIEWLHTDISKVIAIKVIQSLAMKENSKI